MPFDIIIATAMPHMVNYRLEPRFREETMDLDNPPRYEEKEAEAPPAYRKNLVSLGDAPTSYAFGPFPPVMNVWGRFNMDLFKTTHICGATRRARLHAFEPHAGYGRKTPLGTRPGFLLRSGPGKRDPFLAATGDESRAHARHAAYSLSSVVLLPPARPAPNADPRVLVTERMLAATTAHGVAFRFAIETGRAAAAAAAAGMRRERFEWRTAAKPHGEGAWGDDYVLVRLASRRRQPKTATSSSQDSREQSPPASAAVGDQGEELVAELSGVTGTGLSSLVHGFSLRLTGSASEGELGDRCILMVVLTALRILQLRITGRADRKFVAMGEKVRKVTY